MAQDKMALSKKLVTLCDDIDIDIELKDLIYKKFDTTKLLPFLQKYGFKALASGRELVLLTWLSIFLSFINNVVYYTTCRPHGKCTNKKNRYP